MKNLKFPIYFTTSTLVAYTILEQYYSSKVTSFATMIIFSPILLIWMIYKVVNDGGPGSKTFNRYFYEKRRLHLSHATEDFDFFHRELRD